MGGITLWSAVPAEDIAAGVIGHEVAGKTRPVIAGVHSAICATWTMGGFGPLATSRPFKRQVVRAILLKEGRAAPPGRRY